MLEEKRTDGALLNVEVLRKFFAADQLQIEKTIRIFCCFGQCSILNCSRRDLQPYQTGSGTDGCELKEPSGIGVSEGFRIDGEASHNTGGKSLKPGAGGGRAKSAYKDIAALVLYKQGWLKHPGIVCAVPGTRLI